VTSRTTARFRRAYAELPERVRSQARDAYRTFVQDPQHPSLRLKPVHPTRPVYSVRVGLGYRALAVRENEVWIWFWIGSHAEYDRLLTQL
jgi:hypothetical protein